MKQIEKLEETPREILEGVRLLLKGRKILAHELLLSYMFRSNLSVADHREEITLLEEAESDFRELGMRIGELYQRISKRCTDSDSFSSLLDELRATFNNEDVRSIFASYGAAMDSVQTWELSLKGLRIYLDLPELGKDTSFEDAWQKVEGILTTAAGPISRQLAHEFFLDYARIWQSGDPETSSAALEFLQAMSYLFWEQKYKLDAMSHQQADERGWNLEEAELTREELGQIVSAGDGGAQ